jgi:hypothetical protein
MRALLQHHPNELRPYSPRQAVQMAPRQMLKSRFFARESNAGKNERREQPDVCLLGLSFPLVPMADSGREDS